SLFCASVSRTTTRLAFAFLSLFVVFFASLLPSVSPSFLFLMVPLPPSSTLFPYTTLFRSHGSRRAHQDGVTIPDSAAAAGPGPADPTAARPARPAAAGTTAAGPAAAGTRAAHPAAGSTRAGRPAEPRAGERPDPTAVRPRARPGRRGLAPLLALLPLRGCGRRRGLAPLLALRRWSRGTRGRCGAVAGGRGCRGGAAALVPAGADHEEGDRREEEQEEEAEHQHDHDHDHPGEAAGRLGADVDPAGQVVDLGVGHGVAVDLAAAG